VFSKITVKPPYWPGKVLLL